MTWMFLPFTRAFDFAGRSCRREYWMFMLLKVICAALVAIALAFFGVLASASIFTTGGAVALLSNLTVLAAMAGWLLVFLVPEIALTVRRWHDIGNSGWVVAIVFGLSLIPFVRIIAGIVHLVAMCLPGNRGANRYGPNPAPPESAFKPAAA